MTLSVHRRRDRARGRTIRVSFEGRDVTERCFYADGRRGVVRLYALDAGKRKFLRDGRVATEERRGHVRWGRR